MSDLLKYEKRRDAWIREFASQIPGSFDFTEARKCFDAGREDAVEEMGEDKGFWGRTTARLSKNLTKAFLKSKIYEAALERIANRSAYPLVNLNEAEEIAREALDRVKGD